MAEVKKDKPKKKVVMMVILAVIILGIAVSAVFMFTELTMADVQKRFEKHEEYVVSLDSFTVNLSSSTGSGDYLKTQISLMYTDGKKTEMFAVKTSQIRDIIIKDLMGYTSRELLEAGGLDKVKERLKADINTALGEEAVMGIFFTDFLIQ